MARRGSNLPVGRLKAGAPSCVKREDIAALARSAIDNWAAHDDARRFTGPAARGDAAVLQQHEEALRDSPELAEINRLLAERIVAAAK